MKPLSVMRLFALTFFTFALTVHSSTMEPAIYGHKILELAPDMRNTALGLTTFAGLIVAMLAQPIVGTLSDRMRSRLGRRLPFFIGGTVLLVVCIYAVALAPSVPLFVAAVLMMQVGSNTIQGPWQALIPDQVPQGQRGSAASLKALLDILAAIVGRFGAGFLISQFPTLGTLAVIETVSLPVAMLALALLLATWGAREPHDIGRAAQHEPAGVTVATALKRAFAVDLRSYPAFRWWFLNRLLFWCGFIALTVFLLFFAVDVLDMTESNAQRYVGQVSAALGGAVIIATIPTGWMADRFGRKPLIVAAGAIAALGTLVILIMRNVTVLTGVGLVMGMAVGAYLVASWALVTDIVPQQEAARYMGIANIATAGGSALGRLLGGVLIDSLNASLHSVATGYLVVYAIAAGLFLLSAVAILPLRAGARPTP